MSGYKEYTESGLMIGPHAVERFFKDHPEKVTTLYVLKSFGESAEPIVNKDINKNFNKNFNKIGKAAELFKMMASERKAKKLTFKILFLSREALSQKAGSENHQGIILEFLNSALDLKTERDENKRLKINLIKTEADLLSFVQENNKLDKKTNDKKYLRILTLDGVQDPHNLGACLRSADAFGVLCILIPKDNACQMTPVVQKIACGAAQTVPVIVVTNLSRTLQALKKENFWVIGLAGEATLRLDQISQEDWASDLVLVLGSEGSGLRRLTKDHCDYLVKIPMVGQVESLNVSVATGVVLYEARKQIDTQ